MVVERSRDARADPYRDTHVIDSRAPRTNQAVVGVVSVLARRDRLVVAACAARAAARARARLSGGGTACRASLYFEVIQPRFGEGPLEDSRPPRAANIVGLVVLAAASVAYAAGLHDARRRRSASSSRLSRCSPPSPASAPAARRTSSAACSAAGRSSPARCRPNLSTIERLTRLLESRGCGPVPLHGARPPVSPLRPLRSRSPNGRSPPLADLCATDHAGVLARLRCKVTLGSDSRTSSFKLRPRERHRPSADQATARAQGVAHATSSERVAPRAASDSRSHGQASPPAGIQVLPDGVYHPTSKLDRLTSHDLAPEPVRLDTTAAGRSS